MSTRFSQKFLLNDAFASAERFSPELALGTVSQRCPTDWAGRGFKVRREDMKKLLIATRGKVFTLETITQMVEHSRLQEFVAR